MQRRRLLEAFAGLPLGSAELLAGFRLPDHEFAICPAANKFVGTLPRLMELAQVPGVGLGVVQRRILVWSHYGGVADAKKQNPITTASLFPAASLGKPVFAYAVLRMSQKGEIDLDRPLHEFLNDSTLQDARASKITARHVLSHSTGLVNWRDQAGEALVPRFEPGTRFGYSGEGFYVLQRAVEKITGTGFEQFMQDRVFQPLGMTSSTYLWRSDADPRLVAGHRALEPFYNRDFASELWQIIQASGQPLKDWNSDRIVETMTKRNPSGKPPQPNGTVPNVAFSLLTTVQDYCAFLGELTVPKSKEFALTPETRADLMQPYSRINSALSWGLGWGLEQQVDKRFLWQWGDNGGWKNFVLTDLIGDSAVVIFTNGSNGMHIAERAINAASGQENVAFLWV